MRKLTAALLFSVLAIGCTSTSMTSSPVATPGASAELAKKTPTHYRLLSDPGTIRQIDWGRPLTAYHVKGFLTNAGFVPVAKVEGRGSMCEGGQDWVSLSDGEFHAASGGATPQGAYVTGCKNRFGTFQPSGREVQF